MKNTPIYYFSGAGNDFVVLDGRGIDMSDYRETARIQALCREYATDGLMILGEDASVDFTMEFYNPDGSGGMMCGNGARCIVAFADMLGIRPGKRFLRPDGLGMTNEEYLFQAPDGLHTAEILDHPEEERWTVRVKMIDVHGVTSMLGGYFLYTGTRHFVKFVDDVEMVDVETEGKALRWNPAFAPEGTNVNFVQVAPDGLHVRTFEKGVEGETLACGTGITAAAIASYVKDSFIGLRPLRNDKGTDDVFPGTPAAISSPPAVIPSEAKESVRVRARQDWLSVDFAPGRDNTFTDVYLTGPARLVKVI